MMGAFVTLLIYGIFMFIILGCWLFESVEVAENIKGIMFIATLVLIVVALCFIFDTADILAIKQKCQVHGYADTTRYRGNWFCVEYVNKEPVVVPVRLIEEWDK